MARKIRKKILVTGGSGYVGSRVVLKLHRLGYKVISVDIVLPKKRGIGFPKEIKALKGDLKDSKFVKKSVVGVDLVVHLAANIGSLTYMHEHQAEILEDNSAMDAVLYPAMIEAKVKTVVYASSSMVFQNSPKYPYREQDLVKINPPTNVYGMTKLMGEYFCKAFHEQHGLNYVIMRYHNIYGPGEVSKGKSPGDIHVIPALIGKVMSGQYPLEFLGGLNATRPFTYIDDVVDATVLLVEAALKGNPKVLNEDFNIGPRKAIKILDLGRLIWEIAGDGRAFKYTVKETKSKTAVRREMSPVKIRKAIGWQQKVSLKKGIKIVAEWMRKRGSKA